MDLPGNNNVEANVITLPSNIAYSPINIENTEYEQLSAPIHVNIEPVNDNNHSVLSSTSSSIQPNSSSIFADLNYNNYSEIKNYNSILVDNLNPNLSTTADKQSNFASITNFNELDKNIADNYSLNITIANNSFQQFNKKISDHLIQYQQLVTRFQTIISNILFNSLIETNKLVEPELDPDLMIMANKLSNVSQSNNSALINGKILDLAKIKNVDDLRTILADIDQHLSMLKEFEQSHSVACESFTKEIRSRDEALLIKIQQINQMNHQLANMQARVQHLSLKNSQLENEIKYLKTVSSFTNTDTSATPINTDLERIPLPGNQTEFPFASKISINSSQTGTNEKISSLLEPLTYIVNELSQEASQIAPTIAEKNTSVQPSLAETNSETELINSIIEPANQSFVNSTLPESQNSSVDQSPNPNITYQELLQNQHENLKKIFNNNTNELNAQIMNNADEFTNASKPLKSESTLPKLNEMSDWLNNENKDKTEQNEFGSETLTFNGIQDIVTTSNKAYKHFVKMQQDLELLMKKEIDYRKRIETLELRNDYLEQQVKQDDFTISDTQYELNILKHNYDLEIESFSTSINEREAMIEKLQNKMQNFKKRYVKLLEKLKLNEKKLIEAETKNDELNGLLKYEQLQKKTLIDTKISELETQIQESQIQYNQELNNAKMDAVCNELVCKELREKVKELEGSIKNLASEEMEDEFVYYKKEIECLVRQLDQEKQDRLANEEQFEHLIREKDKQLEQSKEQMKKDKDSMIREKTDYEQRFRKLMSKIRNKENEIQQLQEKIIFLEDKFKSKNPNNSNQTSASAEMNENLGKIDADDENGNINNSNKLDNNETILVGKSKEEIIAELALKEIKVNELNGKLEEIDEQTKQLQLAYENEIKRRKQLETFYLYCINNRVNLEQLSNQIQLFQDEFEQQNNRRLANGGWSNGVSTSTTSLSLLMDQDALERCSMITGSDNNGYFNALTKDSSENQSLMIRGKRWLRRQKNIMLFGSIQAKIFRIALISYILSLHYYTILYYYN